jgi:regulator of sirC expression with transglutaminase-like and TPR domain
MNIQDVKAMISLLDDSDMEVVEIVQQKILNMGQEVIPLLEKEKYEYEKNILIHSKIENLLHDLQLENLSSDFQEWVSRDSEDLLKGLWLVSRLAYPDNSIQKLRDEVNRIYMDVWVMTNKEMHPIDLLNVINDVIFNQLKYEPNVKNFHSPSNSLFNKVLEYRVGNPVTLSCLYILLAQRLDIPLYGVNLPNLFVTVFDIPGNRFYVNPFNKGQVFYQKDIDDYLKHMNVEPREEFYKACGNKEIVVRVLTNLAYSYQKLGNDNQGNHVIEILRIINGK